jgi:uncharacterized protein YcbK (DUF882 family)
MVAAILFDVPLVAKVGESPLNTETEVNSEESGFRPVCVVSMSLNSLDVGHRQTLNKRILKTVVNSAIAAFVAASSFAMLESSAFSGGETRTIAMSHIHTGERISVTYMENGRYVPSAMKKINYLLRDWRKNKVVTMDPRTVDLIWELHQDLGSRAEIKIVCGLRTAGTNSMLRRIGRNVAKHSQHVNGKAIDFYFPDVPTVKIRNSALVRKVGGVGYYRSAGGPTGFLHVDTGSVRHWGPYISNSQMAQIERDGRKTVGRRMRLNGGNSYQATPDDTQSSGGGLLAALFGKKKAPAVIVEQAPESIVVAAKPKAPAVEKAYAGSQDDMADLAIDAAVDPTPAKPKKLAVPAPVLVAEVIPAPKPTPVVPKDQIAALNALADDASKAQQTQETEQQAQVADVADAALVEKGPAIPRPRLKPVEIMLMAAANMKPDPKFVRVTPVSAGPTDQAGVEQPSQLDGSLGTLIEAEGLMDEPTPVKPVKKLAIAKPAKKSPVVIKPLLASAGGSDINWWPQEILNDSKLASTNTGQDEAGDQSNAEGKGDLVVVIDRQGKGDLEDASKLLRKGQKLSFN